MKISVLFDWSKKKRDICVVARKQRKQGEERLSRQTNNQVPQVCAQSNVYIQCVTAILFQELRWPLINFMNVKYTQFGVFHLMIFKS